MSYIERNGVRFYHDANMRTITDIEIDPEVDTIEFESFVSFGIFLRNIKKQFPNIKRIVINKNMDTLLDISNIMFPNVKEVISNSDKFLSGPMLVLNSWGTKRLFNTFCKSADEVIDLEGVNSIEEYAFEGCRSTKVINSNSVEYIATNAFKGSVLDMKSGESIADKILVHANAEDGDIIIPDGIRAVAKILDEYQTSKEKRLILNNVMSFINDILSRSNLVFHGTLVVNDKKAFYKDIRRVVNNLEPDCIEVADDNDMYETIDGVLYDKRNAALHIAGRCPGQDVVIPEGIAEISRNAFTDSLVSSVEMPETMQIIGHGAFMKCVNLKHVNLGEGVQRINDNAFMRCLSLEEIEIPGNVTCIGSSAFDGCSNLKKVVFEEGLREICESAFLETQVEEFELPATVSILGTMSLQRAKHITLKSIPNGLIDSFVKAPSAVPESACGDIVTLTINGRDIYIPAVMTLKDKREVDYYFRNNKFTDEEFLDSIHTRFVCTSAKQDAALFLLEKTGRETCRKYLRRCGKNMASRLIKYGNEEKLVSLLKSECLTNKALLDILSDVNESGMTVASAYIIEKTKKNSNRNFAL